MNGSQLYAAKNELNTNITKAAAAAKTEVKAGTNVEVTSETGANNQTIYTVNAKILQHQLKLVLMQLL